MPVSGILREALNTDKVEYGGSGVTNNDFTVDVDTNLYATVRIPPLATVWFERI